MNGTERGIARVALTIAICAVVVLPASAEVLVSGDARALKIEARNASLDEVFAALRGALHFRYSSVGPLGGAVTGTYSGPLRGVLAQLLEGRNYVLHTSAGSLDVSIVGTGGIAKPVAPAGPEPPKDCKYDDGTKVIAVEC